MPTADDVLERGVRLGVRGQARAGQQLALERREKALRHRVLQSRRMLLVLLKHHRFLAQLCSPTWLWTSPTWPSTSPTRPPTSTDLALDLTDTALDLTDTALDLTDTALEPTDTALDLTDAALDLIDTPVDRTNVVGDGGKLLRRRTPQQFNEEAAPNHVAERRTDRNQHHG